MKKDSLFLRFLFNPQEATWHLEKKNVMAAKNVKCRLILWPWSSTPAYIYIYVHIYVYPHLEQWYNFLKFLELENTRHFESNFIAVWNAKCRVIVWSRILLLYMNICMHMCIFIYICKMKTHPSIYQLPSVSLLTIHPDIK